jgi:hypothetical protein
MIAKVLIVLFLVIPLILAVLAFLIGALYLQVQDKQAQSEVC